MAKSLADLRVCIFDVFGTVVDWRGSLIEDLPKLGKKYGLDTDWTSFADDWRGLYQPQMARVRKGELPWTRIDDLARRARGSSRISGTSCGHGLTRSKASA
jgi:2-haloacid dehalogenase